MSRDDWFVGVLFLTPVVGLPLAITVGALGGPGGWVMLAVLLVALLATLFGGVA